MLLGFKGFIKIINKGLNFHTCKHVTDFCLYRSKHELDRDEFMFFLTGGIGLENKLANPAPTWLTEKSWDEICRMCDIKSFKKFR